MKFIWRLIPVSFILLITGCGVENLSALDPKGPVAEMQYSLIQLSLYIMIAVLVVVFAIYIFVLFKFRDKPGDTHIPKQVHGNRTLEIIWTTIPIILLLMLAVPNVMDTFTLADVGVGEEAEESGEADAEDAERDHVRIEVTANQFWWEFNYPDYDATAGQEMYIPTDTRIIVELQSSDVIHSFWVPALAGKQDNIPGVQNDMWFEAPEEGVYQGKCTELCGPSHWLMDFRVIAVDPETFDTWATNMSEPAEELLEPESEVAVDGRAVFEESCITCHAVGQDGGNIGPNLTNYSEREVLAGFLDPTDENLEAWIRNPQEYKPGNEMPSFDSLTDDEVTALIEYMNTLKVLEN
ncbi:cytochrome c oxidase subunit II [Salipaludibacillus neizhouensis]|uniref:Cytochrome c oxidase subunit 2 n=1 Tax=Salipaludibacillus neizhouensis TaxID=885475 RepID=A0A3A9K8P5_9BACI|nr:cytochrome c oxidase subunit II [Salipaludibacillus neizhouensis]RKL68877.1 cytochrome c oxidase subunit II [Salipaludibacillus neizhouensis]